MTPPCSEPATTLRLESGRRQRHRRRPGRHRYAGVQRRQRRREHRPLRQRQPARLTRDVGNIIMDLNGVEHINLNALGGADTITVNDLTGTGVTQVAIDLAPRPAARRRRRGRHCDRQRHPRQRHHQCRQQRRIDVGQRPGGAGDDHRTPRRNDSSSSMALPATTPSMRRASRPARSTLTLNGGDGDDLIIGSAGQ